MPSTDTLGGEETHTKGAGSTGCGLKKPLSGQTPAEDKCKGHHSFLQGSPSLKREPGVPHNNMWDLNNWLAFLIY